MQNICKKNFFYINHIVKSKIRNNHLFNHQISFGKSIWGWITSSISLLIFEPEELVSLVDEAELLPHLARAPLGVSALLVCLHLRLAQGSTLLHLEENPPLFLHFMDLFCCLIKLS